MQVWEQCMPVAHKQASEQHMLEVHKQAWEQHMYFLAERIMAQAVHIWAVYTLAHNIFMALCIFFAVVNCSLTFLFDMIFVVCHAEEISHQSQHHTKPTK